MRKSVSVAFFSLMSTLLIFGTVIMGGSELVLFSNYFAQERYDVLDEVVNVAQRTASHLVQEAALPEGEEYKARTVVVSEEDPGPDEITESNKLFVGEEKILAEARSKYVVQVYVDHYRNGEVVEPIYLYEDTYPGNPLRKLVGAKPTPTPIPSPTPTPTTTTP